MKENLFSKELYEIDGETVALRLIDTFEGGDGALPPEDYLYYSGGMKVQRIYELNVNG